MARALNRTRFRGARALQAKSTATPRPGEIYFEFTTVGQMVRVAAVDAATGVEVVTMGPIATPRADLERLAVQKLKRRLEQNPI